MEITLSDPENSEWTEEEQNKRFCKVLVSPTGSAAATISRLIPQADLVTTLDEVHYMADLIKDGNLKCAEVMLIAQTQVLQAIFTQFTAKMAAAETIVQMEAHSKIALRAQNQCQRTLKTLLEYKNPKRATFIKQQNNAINQQINEGEPEEIPEKEINPANELLEQNHEARLDTGETQEAVGVDSKVETVGELDRTAHGTG